MLNPDPVVNMDLFVLQRFKKKREIFGPKVKGPPPTPTRVNEKSIGENSRTFIIEYDSLILKTDFT